MKPTTGLASESGHWYTVSGLPAYEVMAKNGKMRPVTLRDARRLNLVPSVTGIINCANKPGLNRWLQDQAIDSALTLPREEGEDLDTYRARVVQDAAEQGRKARERGTELHAAIERAFTHQAISAEDEEYVGPVVELVTMQFGEGEAERSFAHEFGYGGKTDWHNDRWVIDFKTKDFGPEDSLKLWDEHKMQLVAYANGLKVPQEGLAIVYVSTRVPGLCEVVEMNRDDVPQAWGMFTSLLKYWQFKNRYWPVFEEAA